MKIKEATKVKEQRKFLQEATQPHPHLKLFAVTKPQQSLFSRRDAQFYQNDA